MWVWNKQDKVEKKLKTYQSMDTFPVIKGYDFEKKFEIKKFFENYTSMGFQGSHVGIAMSIFEEMLNEKKKGMKIFLSCTGNMISSGNREIIAYLVKHNIIDGMVTTAAGLEEDVIKCIKPFHLGTFDVKGKFLADEMIGRIGNIFVPYDRYTYFEKFLNHFFQHIQSRKQLCSYEITQEIGFFIENEANTKDHYKESFLYWASKNNIPVFVPGITDGSFGDIATMYKRNHPEFMIDSVKDNEVLTSLLMNVEKAGCIILGGGIAKHFLLNAAIFRDGFEYSIYMTTASEFDGSDSGGNQEEAITWAKIKPDAKRVKVVADATIVFPLIIASVKDKMK